jgi:hypothetical protein
MSICKSEFGKNYFGRDFDESALISELQDQLQGQENDFIKCVIWLLNGTEVADEDLDVIFDILDEGTPELLKLWGDYKGK